MLQDTQLRKQLPFILITYLFITVSFLDRLIPEGIFFDGALYAAVARNMAIGKGSFWMPYFGHGSFFYEHPPLMLGLQSLFFKILGDHYTTEKIFCFTTWLVTVLLIPMLWKQSKLGQEHKHGYWLALLLWGIVPSVLWAYPNNTMENTMTIFDIVAVLLIYHACENNRGRFLFLSLAGCAVFLASLTKGPVGLFPLAVPVIHWLVFRKDSLVKATTWSVFLTLVVAGIYFILWQFPASQNNLSTYLDIQLFSSLAGKRDKVESSLGRLALLQMLFIELLPAIGLCIILIITSKLSKATINRQNHTNKKAMFYLLVGLAASLPIMVSIKQRSFYLLPSIPFLVAALALFSYPFVSALINKFTLKPKQSRYFYMLLGLVAIACIPYLWKGMGTVSRDHDIIHDMKLIATVVKEKDTVGTCHKMDFDFVFRAYAERYHQVEAKARTDFNQLIVNKEFCGQDFVDSIQGIGFYKLDIGTWKYDVYQKNTAL